MHNAKDSSHYTWENVESSDQLFPYAVLITHKNHVVWDTYRYSRWGRPRNASSFIESKLFAVKSLGDII